VTLISFIGLGLGVLALVVTLALLEGFQASIRQDLVQRATHVRITPLVGRILENPSQLASHLQARLGTVEMVQVVKGTCLVSTAMDAVPASLVGRSDVGDAALDSVLAARIGAGPAETVTVISPRMRLTPLGPLPIRAQCEVQEVKAPAPGNEAGAIVLPLEQAQRLLWGAPVVQSIELRDPDDPWRLYRRVERVTEHWEQPLQVQGLEELHRPLLLALAMERGLIFFAVGLMLVVAALNLLCNVAMIAAEKRVDLAVLSGLGMTPRALRRLFLVLGLSIGAAGAGAGALLGVLVAKVLDLTQALPLPRGVFVVSAVPFRVDPLAVAAVLALALSLALVASWLPARTIARREPAVGLRYE